MDGIASSLWVCRQVGFDLGLGAGSGGIGQKWPRASQGYGVGPNGIDRQLPTLA